MLEQIFESRESFTRSSRKKYIHSSELTNEIKKILSMSVEDLTFYICTDFDPVEVRTIESINNYNLIESSKNELFLEKFANQNYSTEAVKYLSDVFSIEATDDKNEYSSMYQIGMKENNNNKLEKDGDVILIQKILNWIIRAIVSLIKWIQTVFLKALSFFIKNVDISKLNDSKANKDKEIKTTFDVNSFQTYETQSSMLKDVLLKSSNDVINKTNNFNQFLEKHSSDVSRSRMTAAVHYFLGDFVVLLKTFNTKLPTPLVSRDALDFGSLRIDNLLDKGTALMSKAGTEIGNRIFNKRAEPKTIKAYDFLTKNHNAEILTEKARKDIKNLEQLFKENSKSFKTFHQSINEFIKKYTSKEATKDYGKEVKKEIKLIKSALGKIFSMYSHFFAYINKNVVLNFYKLLQTSWKAYNIVTNRGEAMNKDGTQQPQEATKALGVIEKADQASDDAKEGNNE